MRTLVRHCAPSPHPVPVMTQPGPQPSAVPDVTARRQRVTARSALRKGTARGGHGLTAWAALIALAVLASGTAATPAAWIGPVAGLAGGVVLLAVTCNRTTGWSNRTLRIAARVYAAAVALVATGWLAWVALAGPSRLALEVLLPAWLICYLPYWNRHRPRHAHGTEPGETPEVPAEIPVDELLADLRTLVCGPGGKVAGADVTEMPPLEGMRRFQFALVRGKQTVDTVLGARGEIAGVARVPRSRVVAEATEGDVPGERGPEHLAMVTILDAAHPQREIQEFTGPTFDSATGLFDVGPYPDGQMAPARLLKVDEHGSPIRGASGLTAGAPGSGKSRYMERKLMEHLASGLFQVVLLDGQGGASVPGLLDHVGWAALRHEEWLLSLRALGRLMVARTRLIASKRLGHWDPELGPFVQVPFEEAQKPLLDPGVLRLAKHLLQEGEKVGIAVDLSTQFPSQVELGGASGTTGANVLRDLAASGNVTLFRTGSEFAKNVTVGNVTVSPRDLPRIPGMCHPLGASMREAPVRAIRAAEPGDWAHLFNPLPFSKFDIAALDGADQVYSRRMERIEAQLADPSEGELDLAGLDAEIALMLGETAPGQEPARPGKPTAVQAVWEYVCKQPGPVRRDDIVAAVDYGPSSVDKALKALTAQPGGLRKISHGEYERAASGGRA